MEHEEHKELIPWDNDNSHRGTTGHRRLAAQVPPSLLPMVLLRLGLSSDSLSPEISVDTLVEMLQSEHWEERLNAVRMLGWLGSGVPVDLLTTALDDSDSSVRAAALFALGNAGHHAPLHSLVAALSDTDWHVRETAVLALGKQGERVPQEVLQTALHDADSLVRVAAALALQHHTSTSGHEQPAAYDGQQWEQKIMQQKEDHQNSTALSPEAEEWSNAFVAYTRDLGGSPPRALREQQQAYAAQSHTPGEQWQSYTQQTPLESSSTGQMQMFVPPLETSSGEPANEERQRDPIAESAPHEEYRSEAPSGLGEKLTSLPRQHRSSKGWLVLIAIVALLFFLLGRMIAIPNSPVPISFPTSIGQDQKLPKGFSQPDKDAIPFEKQLESSQSLSQALQQIADGLHLTPDEITQQLRGGNNIQDVASNQGIDPDQLHNIEMKAITSLIYSEVKAGNIAGKDADDTIIRLKDNPNMLDKLTSHLFTTSSPVGGLQSGTDLILSNVAYSNLAQNQIASALHLSPQAVTTQLQAGKSLTEIAAAHHLTPDQLRTAELQTYSNVANAAVKTGDLTRGDADAWLKDLSNNPLDLEKITTKLFLNNNNPPPNV